MDWGIVASVLVAIPLFILGMITIVALAFGLIARSMRRKMETGGMPKCPIPGCPMAKAMEDALRAAKRGE
ncbi:MAG: hypothetical protein ACE5JA_08320 [bacterium]